MIRIVVKTRKFQKNSWGRPSLRQNNLSQYKVIQWIFIVANLLPGSLLRNLYSALVHPHLIYGILSWGNAGQLLRKTITLQKRTIRTINKATYNSHIDPLFRSSQVLKVPNLYIYQSALFMFDYRTIQNNLSLSRLATFSLSIVTSKPSRQTRQSDL